MAEQVAEVVYINDRVMESMLDDVVTSKIEAASAMEKLDSEIAAVLRGFEAIAGSVVYLECSAPVGTFADEDKAGMQVYAMDINGFDQENGVEYVCFPGWTVSGADFDGRSVILEKPNNPKVSKAVPLKTATVDLFRIIH